MVKTVSSPLQHPGWRRATIDSRSLVECAKNEKTTEINKLRTGFVHNKLNTVRHYLLSELIKIQHHINALLISKNNTRLTLLNVIKAINISPRL